MAREFYSITDESRKVLTDHVSAIAAEWNKDSSNIYQILSGVQSDHATRIRGLYAACVRAGVEVSPWDASLAEIKSRYRQQLPNHSDIACLTEKITRDADTTAKLVEALKDGSIDGREAAVIRRAIAKERDSLDLLETCLGTPTPLREIARASVSARRNGGGR